MTRARARRGIQYDRAHARRDACKLTYPLASLRGRLRRRRHSRCKFPNVLPGSRVGGAAAVDHHPLECRFHASPLGLIRLMYSPAVDAVAESKANKGLQRRASHPGQGDDAGPAIRGGANAPRAGPNEPVLLLTPRRRLGGNRRSIWLPHCSARADADAEATGPSDPAQTERQTSTVRRQS